MNKKTNEIEFYCPHGCGPFRLAIPSDFDNFGDGLIRTHCPKCMAIITIYIGNKKVEGRVEGQSGEEVSKVVKSLVEMEQDGISISNSIIGILNTGEIEDIQSISLNISSLQKSGDDRIAEAIKSLAEAIIQSEELAEEERSMVLDLLEELSKQAVYEPSERSKSVVIRTILSGIASTLGAAGSLAEVWSVWGPVIRSFFGV